MDIEKQHKIEKLKKEFLLFLLPHRKLQTVDPAIVKLWKEKEESEFFSVSKLALIMGSLIYLGHYYFYDVPIGVTNHNITWVVYRFGMSALCFLLFLLFHYRPLTPFFINKWLLTLFLFLVCYLQALSMVWSHSVQFMVSIILDIICVFVLRESILMSILLLLSLVLVQYPVLHSLHLPITHIGSITSLGIGLIVFARSRMTIDLDFFIENHRRIESEKKLVENTQKIYSQVAHDIRSPLTALNIFVQNILHRLPEEERFILRSQVQRIHDITNELVQKKKELAAIHERKQNDYRLAPQVQLVSCAIDEIVSEKRLEFRSRINLDFDVNVEASYGLFAFFNPADLKRILSNLINNSVESYDQQIANIKIEVSADEKNVKIMISDQGKGIPAHIQGRIGEKGFSYGKTKSIRSGQGLGLFYAQNKLKEWGGCLSIVSSTKKTAQSSSGTNVAIFLVRAPRPLWFASSIVLPQNRSIAIVILDDDQGIHQTWDFRFAPFLMQNSACKLFHFTEPDGFAKWVLTSAGDWKDVLYLCDYELLGFAENGLDLIKKLHLANTFLVTSHYEDEKIQAECERLKICLIPKNFAGIVPLIVFADDDIIEYVYIDDDPYLRMGWEMTAKKKAVSLLTFASPDEFDRSLEHLSQKIIDRKKTKVYIDSDLGIKQMKGEDFARILRDRGYEKVVLATSYSPRDFEHLSWLEVRGKECPF